MKYYWISMISKQNLKDFIEPHFHNELTKEVYTTESIHSYKLLTHTRLDIAFKILYLEMLEFDVAFAKKIYKEHIRAFSLGTFIEPGNADKNSIDKYIEDFYNTFKDIKHHGFDSSKTLIPLSQNGSIANGAHRVASAIFLDKDITCVKLDTYDHIYDYKFFYKRSIPSTMLDTVVTRFVEYTNNVYIAFIWPIAQSSDKQIESIIPNIVYKKEIVLNPNGAHNLLSQIYYGEKWLGNVENNFSGSKEKLAECFKTFDPIKVIAFQAESLEQVLKIKETIRKTFNVGKHSIHITDTKEEAIRTAQIVFNDNSIHFLNYAKPNKYISTYQKIDTFKEFLDKNNLHKKEVLIDAGMVLSAYGLREAKDVDYFCSDNEKIEILIDDINIHDEALIHYDEKKNEMIYDPNFYFHFNELKFISFSQLYKMKSNRDEKKDKNDCKMMEALIENNKFKGVVNKLKQSIFYGQIIIRQKSIQLLQQIGLFNITKSLYKKIKGYNE